MGSSIANADFPELAISSSGQEYLAYVDTSAIAYDLKLKIYSGGNWDTDAGGGIDISCSDVTVDGMGTFPPDDCYVSTSSSKVSMVLDGNNPIVGFVKTVDFGDNGAVDRCNLYKYNGSSWSGYFEDMVVSGFGTFEGGELGFAGTWGDSNPFCEDVELALDDNNKLGVVYTLNNGSNYADPDNIYLKQEAGASTWPNPTFNDRNGGNPLVGFDPYIAFNDSSNALIDGFLMSYITTSGYNLDYYSESGDEINDFYGDESSDRGKAKILINKYASDDTPYVLNTRESSSPPTIMPYINYFGNYGFGALTTGVAPVSSNFNELYIDESITLNDGTVKLYLSDSSIVDENATILYYDETDGWLNEGTPITDNKVSLNLTTGNGLFWYLQLYDPMHELEYFSVGGPEVSELNFSADPFSGGDTQCSDGDDNDEDGFDDMDDPGCSNPDDNSEGSPARGLFAGLAEGDVSEMQKISDQSGGALIGFTNPLDYSANNYLDNLSEYDDEYEDIFGQAPTGGQVVVMGLLRDIHYENVSDIASVVSINSVNMDGVGVDGGATVHQMQTTCDGFKIYYYDGFARDYEYIKNNATAVCDSEDTGTWASCNINSISCSNGKASIEFDSFSSYGIEGTGGVVDYMFEDHDSTDGEVHIDSVSSNERDLSISWTKPGAVPYQSGDTITFSFKDEEGDVWSESLGQCTNDGDKAVLNQSTAVAGGTGGFTFPGNGQAVWTFTGNTTTDAMQVCVKLPDTAQSENIFVSILGYTYGGGLIYVNDSNDVTVTATVIPQLEFDILTSDASTDTNACDLGQLTSSATSTCSYRLRVLSNASDGYTVQVKANGPLTSGSHDINYVSDDLVDGDNGGSATEEYGVSIAPGSSSVPTTTLTLQGNFVSGNHNDLGTTAENLVIANGPNFPSSSGDTTNTAEITHHAQVSSDTPTGAYTQTATYYVTASF